MARNPFERDFENRPANPFGDDEGVDQLEAAAKRVEHAARKIRTLRSQLGAEGLSPSAERELLDELSAGMDAAARAVRILQRDRNA